MQRGLLKEFVLACKEIGMILFYAWTDTQIINVVNLKSNVFQKQDADLLVYRLERVSERLIDEIKKKNLFHQVYLLEVPKFCLERKRKGIREKIQALFLGAKYRQYFYESLQILLGSINYSLFFAGAFWSETLLVFGYVKRNNPQIRIWFYDEGLAAYNGPKNWLFQAVPNRSLQAKIRTILYYGFSSVIYRKYVDGIYLYKPELSNIDYMIKRHIFAPEKVKLFIPEHEEADKYWSQIYEECDVIYIVEAPNLKSKYPLAYTYKVLEEIYEVMPEAEVVLKTHPIMKSAGVEFDKKRFINLFIDNRNDSIESFLHRIDIDKKIVITENSTSALYLKWVYGKTPYIVLMNRKKTKLVQEYMTKFIEAYDTGKGYMSETIDDLKDILKSLEKILYSTGGERQ